MNSASSLQIIQKLVLFREVLSWKCSHVLLRNEGKWSDIPDIEIVAFKKTWIKSWELKYKKLISKNLNFLQRNNCRVDKQIFQSWKINENTGEEANMVVNLAILALTGQREGEICLFNVRLRCIVSTRVSTVRPCVVVWMRMVTKGSFTETLGPQLRELFKEVLSNSSYWKECVARVGFWGFKGPASLPLYFLFVDETQALSAIPAACPMPLPWCSGTKPLKL